MNAVRWLRCARRGCKTMVRVGPRTDIAWCHEHPGLYHMFDDEPDLKRVATIRQHRPWERRSR